MILNGRYELDKFLKYKDVSLEIKSKVIHTMDYYT